MKDAPRYGIVREVALSFEDADARVRMELKEEGFGILTEIDVKATLKEKLDVDFPPYRILGACNPPIAHQALLAEPDVGLLLPCNVVVRQVEQSVIVEALDPVVQLEVANNPALNDAARDVRARLTRAIERLPGVMGA
ncbi:MAG TPA: DUF302 domain-containing protein [Longimicrobiales bacterium]|nr:DUF302 domain-containing protein [Longimicrobiales bacterium]